MPFLKVTKIDAARRQLEIAVLLYFNERDSLAIHTLAAAAQGVLETLAKRAGKTTPLHDSLADLPADLTKQLRVALHGPQNFLKHSDRDPDAVLEFSPDLTEVILYDAIAAYVRLTGDLSPFLNAFVMWVGISHPSWFAGASPELQRTLKTGREHLVAEGRSSFLENYLARNPRLRP